MIEVKNLTKEEVLEVVSRFDLVPLFDKVIITTNKEPQDYLDLDNQILDDVQYVVAKGSHVSSVDEGDRVLVDLKKLTRQTLNPRNQDESISQIEIDPYIFEDVLFAIVSDRVLKAKYK